MRAIAVVLVLLLPSLAVAAPRRYVEPRTARDQNAPPFSGAVQVGDTLYLSGILGVDDQRRVPDDPQVEVRTMLERVKQKLEAVGFTMDDLVYVQVFCSDVSQYDTFNRIYRGYFQKEFPARAFVGAGPLLFGARFEIQAIAAQR